MRRKVISGDLKGSHVISSRGKAAQLGQGATALPSPGTGIRRGYTGWEGLSSTKKTQVTAFVVGQALRQHMAIKC